MFGKTRRAELRRSSRSLAERGPRFCATAESRMMKSKRYESWIRSVSEMPSDAMLRCPYSSAKRSPSPVEKPPRGSRY
jgi:hypothetical protein